MVSTRKEKYALEPKPIGRGGQAEVFRARNKRTGEIVALKRLLNRSEGTIARMRREIEVQTSLDHPNIMPIYDYSTSYVWYTMPMASLVLGKMETSIDTNSIFDIVKDCAQGLLVSHMRGIIHRDITPNNIFCLCDDDGKRWVVSDWGLVRQHGKTTVVRTLSGQEFGTAGYAAPEMWKNAHDADVITHSSQEWEGREVQKALE
jgi:serine/threonine-protein kinase